MPACMQTPALGYPKSVSFLSETKRLITHYGELMHLPLLRQRMQHIITPVFNPETGPACLPQCTHVAVCFPPYAVTKLKQRQAGKEKTQGTQKKSLHMNTTLQG